MTTTVSPEYVLYGNERIPEFRGEHTVGVTRQLFSLTAGGNGCSTCENAAKQGYDPTWPHGDMARWPILAIGFDIDDRY